MFKVRMFGAIDSLSTALNFDTALKMLYPALGMCDVSGAIVDCETGEVIVIIVDGEVIHIAEQTIFQMLDSMFEKNPEETLLFVLGLLVEGL